MVWTRGTERAYNETCLQHREGRRQARIQGQEGRLEVTIELERMSSATTRVEVTARKNLAEWDKEYAQQLLSRIVEKS